MKHRKVVGLVWVAVRLEWQGVAVVAMIVMKGLLVVQLERVWQIGGLLSQRLEKIPWRLLAKRLEVEVQSVA